MLECRVGLKSSHFGLYHSSTSYRFACAGHAGGACPSHEAGAKLGNPQMLPGRTFLWWVCLHMAVQLGFTVGIHWSSSVGPMNSTRTSLRAYALVNGSLLVGFLAYFASLVLRAPCALDLRIHQDIKARCSDSFR